METSTPLPPLVHSPASAAQRLSMATRTFYDLIASGEIRSFKQGKRRLVPDTELQRYVERKLAQAEAA